MLVFAIGQEYLGLEPAKTVNNESKKEVLASVRPQWWAIVDSNHRPRSYQDRALTN